MLKILNISNKNVNLGFNEIGYDGYANMNEGNYQIR